MLKLLQKQFHIIQVIDLCGMRRKVILWVFSTVCVDDKEKERERKRRRRNQKHLRIKDH